MSMPAAAGAAFAAIALAGVLSEGLRRLALRYGLTDSPCPRKPHSRATPYLGGVAIASASLISACAFIPHPDRRLIVVMVASAVVAVLGLADDIRPLSRTSRIVTETLAASAVVAGGGRIIVSGTWLDAIMTVVWIVVLTNSFNLLDNMDGAAAAIASASACCVAGTAYLAGRADIAVFLLAMAAGCVGFLVHNWSPARIFMGDAGSLFIGFVISATIVMIRVPGGPASAIAGSFLLMFVAVVDTSLVVISRLRAGISWLTAGTDHTSHRLYRMGFSAGQVAIIMFAVAIVSGLLGIFVSDGRLPGMITLVVTAIVAAIIVLLLGRIPTHYTMAGDKAAE